MPQVGFELTIPVFVRAKTVHALNRAAIVIGRVNSYSNKSAGISVIYSH
jgi:exosome complex RNA-binding protein Csl4